MHTTTNVHLGADDAVRGSILATPTGTRFMCLSLGPAYQRVSLLITDPEFLDKLSNEADRLCREFVEGAPPLVIGGTSSVSVEPRANRRCDPDETVLEAAFEAYQSERGLP